MTRLLRVSALAGIAAACLSVPATTAPHLDGEGRRLLFVGNSYTYSADIPGIVQALADSAGGDKLAVETVAGPDMALIDHWNQGTAKREIQKGGWEWIVLQQGPSAADLSRDTLRLATRLFADVMPAGTRAALFSAWPSAARRQDFPRAIESYALAATDVHGLLLPIAAGWLAAWNRDDALQLYADGLHPSVAGAYLSALIIYSRLLGSSPKGLPSSVRLHSGALLSVDPAVATTLQDAAVEALGLPPD